MRMHFYDLLKDSVINPREELNKLRTLFSMEKYYCPSEYSKISLEQYVNQKLFRNLSFRGSYIDIESMRKSLGISEHNFTHDYTKTPFPLEILFLFCEFLLAIGVECEQELLKTPVFYKQLNTIMENIQHLLEKTNHQLENISETNITRYIIVEKNKLTTQAVNVITEKSVALSAIEYNHFTLCGDLCKKQSILTTIATYVEPILNSNILKNNGYSQLQSDAGFLLNNFHIRHNNKTGTKQKDYISTISDKDLEQWYDMTYSVLLSVIVEEQNVDTHIKLENLKSSYKW